MSFTCFTHQPNTDQNCLQFFIQILFKFKPHSKVTINKLKNDKLNLVATVVGKRHGLISLIWCIKCKSFIVKSAPVLINSHLTGSWLLRLHHFLRQNKHYKPQMVFNEIKVNELTLNVRTRTVCQIKLKLLTYIYTIYFLCNNITLMFKFLFQFLNHTTECVFFTHQQPGTFLRFLFIFFVIFYFVLMNIIPDQFSCHFKQMHKKCERSQESDKTFCRNCNEDK